jgi:putative zinc finger protein
MKPFRCPAERDLEAYHDGELALADQIAISAHLSLCADCARALDELETLRLALRGSFGRRARPDNAAALTSAVIDRWKAEQQASFASRVSFLFEDLHLVYAGLGALAATAACVVAMLGMMRLATDGRPDSLGGVVNVVATGGAAAAPIIDSEVEMRWAARFRQANAAAERDAVFALQDALARQEWPASASRGRSAGEAREIESLLDNLSRARFRQDVESATGARMVWIGTRTTVRPKLTS